jgi:hypothetical protein
MFDDFLDLSHISSNTSNNYFVQIMYRKGRLEGSGCGLVASNYRPRHGVLGPHF